MKKIAIIELSPRTCKLLVAKYTDNGLTCVTDELVEPLRLWADIEIDNVIKPVRTSDAIDIVKNIKKRLEKFNVETIIPYCTNELKNVKNYRSFIEQLNCESMIKFDILDKDKVFSAIHTINYNTMEQTKSIVIDVEDECINIVKYNRRNILDTCKFNFGSLTLAKVFENETEMSTSDKLEKMVEYAKEQFIKSEIFNSEEDEFKKIGMGNTFINAGRIARMGSKYPLNLDHNYELTIENFQKSYDAIKNLSADKTQKIRGLVATRADCVISGFAIIKALMDCFCINQFNINDLSVMNGVMLSTVGSLNMDKQTNDILTQSLEACNVFYDDDEYSCKNVYNYANDLFEELRVLHRFTKHQQKILKIASYLSNCGMRISAKNFEKNSFYIVLNSDIYGATHKEILLASFVCASQNLEEFDFSNWVRYKDILTESDLNIVKKLAVLVKLARLIDVTKVADHIVCDVLGDKCILNVIPKTTAIPIFDDLRGACNDFYKAFDKKMQIL